MALPSSFKEVAKGIYTVLAGDVTATYAQITCDLSIVTGVVFTITRAGVALAGGTMTLPGGANLDKFRIATGGSYTITAGDVISYVAF